MEQELAQQQKNLLSHIDSFLEESASFIKPAESTLAAMQAIFLEKKVCLAQTKHRFIWFETQLINQVVACSKQQVLFMLRK